MSRNSDRTDLLLTLLDFLSVVVEFMTYVVLPLQILPSPVCDGDQPEPQQKFQ